MLNALKRLLSAFGAKIAGYLAAFTAGWLVKDKQIETERRKEAEQEAEAWRNKPRNKRELVKRLRDKAKRSS